MTEPDLHGTVVPAPAVLESRGVCVVSSFVLDAEGPDHWPERDSNEETAST